MPKPLLEDTIAAIATPIGQGGIGIIRLSGTKALSVADKIFIGKKKKKPSQSKSFTIHYGWIMSRAKTKDQRPKTEDRKPKAEGEIIDEVLLTVMRAPKSYTCEDIVEISCHGGIVPMRAILSLILDSGVRLAEPGEFTKRAYLNGRIDLTQAEAVLDIIKSRTDTFLTVSMNQLKGELTVELEAMREALMSVYTHIEAIVNFPEDEVESTDKKRLMGQIDSQLVQVKKLLESGTQGRILKEGIKVVICGRPNVGKSSLLNTLLKQPRAIVTDIAGTTRDTIEETASIRGIPFQLVDTAGILKPRDRVEEEAVKRSHICIENADLVLFVLDASRPLSLEDESLFARVKDRNTLIVLNKCDLPAQIDEKKLKDTFQGKKILRISALKKIAVHALEDKIVQNVWQGNITDAPRLLISNVRHIDSLKNAAASLEKAKEALKSHLPFELVSEEIKAAVSFLDAITGRNIDSDLLDKIFAEFCIGK